MNGYSLQSSSDGWYLKNWVIEGKNEGEKWKEIDRQDNNDLNGNFNQHYYLLQEKTQPYQYIRLRCIGQNHHYGTYYYTVINKIEIYGEIKEDDE